MDSLTLFRAMIWKSFLSNISLNIRERSDDAVERTLASHQCGLGSIPRSGVICGLSLLVLYPALGTPVSPLLENQHFT